MKERVCWQNVAEIEHDLSIFCHTPVGFMPRDRSKFGRSSRSSGFGLGPAGGVTGRHGPGWWWQGVFHPFEAQGRGKFAAGQVGPGRVGVFFDHFFQIFFGFSRG